jgi:hypothetical protein
MKRGIIILFLVIIFSSFVNAQPYLNESSVWQQNLTFDTSYHKASAFGDIDNDGDQDMVHIGCDGGDLLGSCTTPSSRVYVNNGTSLVENQTWQQNLTPAFVSIAFGDIDNDGDLDLILDGDTIYINNGTSLVENQTWQQEVITLTSGSGSTNLGDIDNDGDLDLILADNDPGESVLLNNGITFVNNVTWGAETRDDFRASSVLVDIDNDGDLDSMCSGYNYGSVYINNGTTLELSSIWGAAGGDHVSIAVGDVDNDGDMDEFAQRLAGACGTSDLFLQNNGTALLRNSTYEDSLPSFYFGSAAFGDYNNDGYLDLVVNGQCGGTGYVDIRLGNASSFSPSDENLGGSQSGSVTWVDIDGDNNLDLIDIARKSVYINNLTTNNIAPTAPGSFSYSYNNREINLGWLNGSDNETPVDGLYYNLKLGTISNNHSIISGVYGGQGDVSGGGGTAFGYFGNMMQRKNITLKVDRLSPSTTYYWSVQTIDTALKAGNWSSVQSFTTPVDMERPSINLNSPVDDFNSSSYTITFNVTVSDNMNLSNVSLWGNWSGWHLNETNSSGLNATDYIFTKSLSGYSNGYYAWKIQAEDNETNVLNSSTRVLTLDTLAPNVTINSPTNTSYNTSAITFNITVTDNLTSVDSCRYSLNGATNISLENFAGNFWNASNSSMTEALHTAIFYCNDTAGNLNSTESVVFTVDVTDPNIAFNSSNTTSEGNNSKHNCFRCKSGYHNPLFV